MSKKSFDKRSAEEIKQEEKVLKENAKETINDSDAKTEGMTDKTEDANAADSEETKTEEIKSDKEENDAAKQELENLNNKLLRLQADYLNFKNRTEKEKLSMYSNAVADVIQDLLPVVDNLERALQTDSTVDNNFKDGVQMVYDQLIGILDKRGLKEIEALHKPFDPNLHFGVAFDSTSEEADDTVIEVFQKGFTVSNKVIRPSMVKIAKK